MARSTNVVHQYDNFEIGRVWFSLCGIKLTITGYAHGTSYPHLVTCKKCKAILAKARVRI